MTQNANPLRRDHVTNGTATDFLYDWQIDSASELLVTKINLLVTPNTEEILNSGFTVSGIGNPSGGNVIISPALATGSKIVLTSNIPFNQTANFTDQNSVKPVEVMAMADRLSRQIKKLAEQVSRAVLTTFADGVQDANTFLASVIQYRADALAAANTATTQAGTATTQAGVSTTKASEAHADAQAAAAALAGANFGLSTGRAQIITTGFTAGVTTVLPALTPDKPANEEAADIHFYNGTTYISTPAPDRYSYNFSTGVFTLSDVVPAGTTKIVVKWWTYLAQGTVADNSVDFLTKMISIAGDKVAAWIGGVATALDFNQSTALGASTTKIPSEKVVSDAVAAAIGGIASALPKYGITFDGTLGTPIPLYDVGGCTVTKTGTGNYRITFPVAMASKNYIAVVTSSYAASLGTTIPSNTTYLQTAGYIDIACYQTSGFADHKIVSLMVWGDLS